MIFKGWRKTSLLEYPGKICTVLFTGGCNFRCPFCYNGELITRPETLPDISAHQVLGYLKENRRLYQALAVTGGEPTLHPELPGFLSQVRSLGFAVNLETNGTNPEMVKELIAAKSVDYVSMDTKSTLEAAPYAQATGNSDEKLFARVVESVELLRDGPGVDCEFRLTVVPDFHPEERILALGEQLAGGQLLVLQQFVPREALDLQLRKRKPYPSSYLEQLAGRLSEKLPCIVREF